LISTDLPPANPHTRLPHAPTSVAQLHRPRAGSTEFLTNQVVTGHMPTGTTDRCEITENATGSPQLGTTGQTYIAAVATEESPAASPVPRAGFLPAPEEPQPELADLDLVTARQRCLIHRLPVHVGAVETADIADDVLPALTAELGVSPRHRHVVEEDVAVRVSTHTGDVTVEQEP